MGRTDSGSQKIIGRVEQVSFPEWDLFDLDAKIDTGAYTSSLHCHQIEKSEREGTSYVSFRLLDPTHETYDGKHFELPIHKQKIVKSSNGIAEERFIVKTTMLLDGLEISIELSLTDRSGMRYPVLLGRKVLKGRFLVDVTRKFLADQNGSQQGSIK